MAVVGELLVLLAGNNAMLTRTLAQSEGQLKVFGATTTSTTAMAGAALGGIGLVAAAGMGLAVNAAKNFQEQMAIINTIAHQTPDQLDATGASIRALAVSSGTGLGDLTKAYYDLLSAGIKPGEDALNALTLANTLAIGGLATTSQTVDLLTTAINAYSLDAAGAAVATDQFALAIQDGKVTADEIAATFADVAPLARQAGVGIDEISAAYAVLTARGTPAAEVTTQMNRAMIELLKPNAELNALQTKTGINFAALAADKGLVVSLQAMRDAAAANNVPFQDLFGRLEGLKFALATTGPAFDAYVAELAAMDTGAGGTAIEQMTERMGTLDRQLAIFGTSANDLGITLGTALLPPLTAIFQAINGGVQSVTAWANANPQLSSSLLPIIAAVGLLGAGIAILGAPFVAIGVAVALVVTHFDELQRGLQVVNQFVGPLASAIGTVLGAAINNVAGAIAAIVQGFKDAIGLAQTLAAWATGESRPAPPTGPSFVPGSGGRFGPMLAPPGLVGPRGPGNQPIVLNHTTINQIDSREIGRSVETILYNDASVFSSGFATDERGHH